MKIVSRLILLVVLLGLWGKVGAANHGSIAGTQRVAVAKSPLLATDCVIEANGLKVTKADYEDYVRMTRELLLNKNPKLRAKDAAALRSFDAKIRKSTPNSFIQRLVLLTRITNSVPAESRLDVEKKVQARYVKSFAHKGQDFAAFTNSLAKVGCLALLLRDYELDLKVEYAFQTTYSNRICVTEADITKARADVQSYNANAQATNAVTERLARQILKRLHAGEPFTKLADAYSQDPEKKPGGDMGECVADDFKLSERVYWERVSALKEGGISDLLTTDEGYEIVTLIKRVKADDSESGLPALHLARIFFRKAYLFPEQSDEDFRSDIAVEKRELFLREFIKDLFKTSKIRLPRGRAAFKNAL